MMNQFTIMTVTGRLIQISFYIRYSCDFDKDLKTLPSPWAIISFSARIIDKTIFIEDYYTKDLVLVAHY